MPAFTLIVPNAWQGLSGNVPPPAPHFAPGAYGKCSLPGSSGHLPLSAGCAPSCSGLISLCSPPFPTPGGNAFLLSLSLGFSEVPGTRPEEETLDGFPKSCHR